MQVINRELHIVTRDGYRETYEEYCTESNVETLWYDRLHTNTDIERATLVYRVEKTGVIVEQIKLK